MLLKAYYKLVGVVLQPTLNELNNGVINAAFLLLFKDLIRLFACYNDGIINLLGESPLLDLYLRPPLP